MKPLWSLVASATSSFWETLDSITINELSSLEPQTKPFWAPELTFAYMWYFAIFTLFMCIQTDRSFFFSHSEKYMICDHCSALLGSDDYVSVCCHDHGWAHTQMDTQRPRFLKMVTGITIMWPEVHRARKSINKHLCSWRPCRLWTGFTRNRLAVTNLHAGASSSQLLACI